MPKLFRITTVPISVEKLLGNQLTYMNQFFDVTAISSDKKELSRIGVDLGVKTYAIEMSRQITPFKDLKSLWLMYCYFKKEKPDIVHTHTPKAGLIGMLAAKIAGVKMRLHTVAGLPLMETSGVKRILLNNIEKLTYACATKVYPNSYGLRDFILNEKLCHSKKLHVICNGSTNGIDTDYFNPDLFSQEKKRNLRKELGIDENNFVFVFVGRLVKDKGINELVSAFRKISLEINQNSSLTRFKLLLVGSLEEDLDPLLPETLTEINHNHNIISVGFQKDVRPYLAISNALVFPSYREGFPNVVMQAGAMGLPSIVSNINGCNEIIIGNENGIIVSAKNEIELETAMEKILDNHHLYQSMAINARPMIESRYQQQLIWDYIKKEYLT
ncbi:glycosyltransferase family 4 protein [Epilithonimonas zeae]|uniref:glycosyltransferase family 4 protein n=1 Tax=Epilithonimonas zeae TaxID=1416779 RepID=UPI002010680A|nr:glycosyltransferase family 4 protein [Epilithonimonas zeae]UQB67442.1 glycosyltransferase family 4 protein [Epilithonimonas zeae]